MRVRLLVRALLVALAAVPACRLLAQIATPASAPSGQTTGAFRYPEARRSDQSDNYFGTTVADPYRWLEDTDSPETTQWIAAENALTESYLAAIPGRAQLKERLTALWNYAKYDPPIKRGKTYFYTENSGLQNQKVLYAQKAPDSTGTSQRRVVLDPNTLSADGTVALTAWSVPENGKLLGYAVSASGSDWREIRVRDVQTGKDLSDTLRWVKFTSPAWTRDSKGFFYSRYPAPPAGGAPLRDKTVGQQLAYHRIGDPQSKDEVIWEAGNDPELYVNSEVSDDGEYLIIYINKGTDPRNKLYIKDLRNPGSPQIDNPIVRLIDDADASYTFIDNWREMFFIHTDLMAPKGRVVLVDVARETRRFWRTIVQEDRDKLESVQLIGGELVCNYLHDAHSVVKFYTLSGGASGELTLPALGTVSAITGRPDDEEMFYSFTSFLQPTSIYRFDVKRKAGAPIRVPKLPADVSPYETRQVIYTSKDGTKVPMFITAKKGLKLDGSNPTLLYAYGGFDISLTPGFSPGRFAWLEMGGIYAVANIRGGGEYGEEWHQAGMFEKKQNVFDDFIAAAEFLVKEKYTSPGKLVVQGGSNGGLLVGALLTQRPDLFAVALPAVGVMDMLRYQKFTVGWGWKAEYGSSDDSTQFRYLIKYSPLHNIKAGTQYPATLVTTSDHDDRVVPGHSLKFAAALQAAQAGPAPILLRVDAKAGHGAGRPTSKQIDLITDELSFAARNVGLTQIAQ